MCRVYMAMLLLFMPMYMVGMDQLLEEDDLYSIVAINVFDNDISTTGDLQDRLKKEALLFAKYAIEKNPLIVNKKLFEGFVQRNDAEEAFFVVKNSWKLRKYCPLAEVMWRVGCNNASGFELVPGRDYEEEVLPHECIAKTFLLLACKKKNKDFLSEYQQAHGTKMLHVNIGNNFYEEIYGATALKDIIGKVAYDKFRLEHYISEHLKKFNLLFSDEVLDNQDDQQRF
jgi:hypothetical protein